jgi:GntR family transcriptional regulator
LSDKLPFAYGPVAGGPVKKRLSFRVRDELANRIASGRIPKGSKLPPEPALAEELGVSRPTLREALRSLEEDGFVTRTRGAGTYATHRPRLQNNLDVNFGVTEAIRAAAMTPGTAETAVHTEGASEQQAAALDLRPGDPVVVLERVRTADLRPVVFSRDVVSVTTLSAIELAGMQLDGSVYAILELHGHAVEHGVVRIEPHRAHRTLARKLGVKSGALMLYLVQVDFGREGDPILLSEEYHLADAFEFTVVRRGPGRGTT